MQIERFSIDGPALIETRIFQDARGFFTERFRDDQWASLFPDHPGFIQDNYSWSKFGVLRGLHYQFNPDQGKLVTCVQGSIMDVVVDIRPKSSTFGKHIHVVLKAERPEWFWIPPGFAHAFIVTSEHGAGVLYRVDQPYSPTTEGAIKWNDPDLNINWPIALPLVSEKDDAAPSFAKYASSMR